MDFATVLLAPSYYNFNSYSGASQQGKLKMGHLSLEERHVIDQQMLLYFFTVIAFYGCCFNVKVIAVPSPSV